MWEYEKGLNPLDGTLFERWGMTTLAPQTFTADGFMDLLERFGPIWVAADVRAPHVRVAIGFEFGNPSYMGPVHINDPLGRGFQNFRSPNRGSQYTESYKEFVGRNEKLGAEELNDPTLESDTLYPVYFAHLKAQAYAHAQLRPVDIV
jgi:Papain-like cysteine protease AvrRpt2